MSYDARQELIYQKIELFFGDEPLSFQKARLIKLIEDASTNKFDESLSTITQLLFIHNEMIDLIDIGYLLNQSPKKRPKKSGGYKTLKTIKKLRRMIGHWENFPSHLAAFELTNPVVVIQKFFLIHDIYDWKLLIRRFFDSALGNLPMGETCDEFNIALDTIELFRLLDAVWLINVSVVDNVIDTADAE